jgi:hypothetical protein
MSQNPFHYLQLYPSKYFSITTYSYTLANISAAYYQGNHVREITNSHYMLGEGAVII